MHGYGQCPEGASPSSGAGCSRRTTDRQEQAKPADQLKERG
jgi:hypothetical protein